MIDRLKKVALITGGACRIGKALAIDLAILIPCVFAAIPMIVSKQLPLWDTPTLPTLGRHPTTI